MSTIQPEDVDPEEEDQKDEDEDANRQSIDPYFWGKSFWEALHFATIDYPMLPSPEEKQAFFNYFSSLQYILPCANCRDHYRTFWQTHSIEPFLDAPGIRLREWGLLLHNTVNQRLGKMTWSLESLNLKYDKRNEDPPLRLLDPTAPIQATAPPPPPMFTIPKAPSAPPPIMRPRYVYAGNGVGASRAASTAPRLASNIPAKNTKKKTCKNCKRRDY